MTTGTAGRARTLAGRLAAETEPKWWAMSGAVATVAATVTAIPSASSRGSRPRRLRSGGASTMIPATAANDSCQPTSPAARGLSASVAAAASNSA